MTHGGTSSNANYTNALIFFTATRPLLTPSLSPWGGEGKYGWIRERDFLSAFFLPFS